MNAEKWDKDDSNFHHPFISTLIFLFSSDWEQVDPKLFKTTKNFDEKKNLVFFGVFFRFAAGQSRSRRHLIEKTIFNDLKWGKMISLASFSDLTMEPRNNFSSLSRQNRKTCSATQITRWEQNKNVNCMAVPLPETSSLQYYRVLVNL